MLADTRSPVAYVARHGQTLLNSEKRFRGNANPPLDATGLKQAGGLARLFSNIPISHIFSSDRIRSTVTAETIGRGKKLPVHLTEGLRALDVGQFSGQKRDKSSEAALQVYLDSPETKIPGGESLQDFRNRIKPCLLEAIEIYCTSGEPVLLVAHSSVVHEIGNISNGDHTSVLVEPGGAIAVYYTNGKIEAEPIFRPIKSSGSHAETIT